MQERERGRSGGQHLVVGGIILEEEEMSVSVSASVSASVYVP